MHGEAIPRPEVISHQTRVYSNIILDEIRRPLDRLGCYSKMWGLQTSSSTCCPWLQWPAIPAILFLPESTYTSERCTTSTCWQIEWLEDAVSSLGLGCWRAWVLQLDGLGGSNPSFNTWEAVGHKARYDLGTPVNPLSRWQSGLAGMLWGWQKDRLWISQHTENTQKITESKPHL